MALYYGYCLHLANDLHFAIIILHLLLSIDFTAISPIVSLLKLYKFSQFVPTGIRVPHYRFEFAYYAFFIQFL